MLENKKDIYFVISGMHGGGAENVLSIILNHLNRKKFIPKLILFKKAGEYETAHGGDNWTYEIVPVAAEGD